MRVVPFFFGLFLWLSSPVPAEQPPFPVGNCATRPFLERLEGWCEAVRGVSAPKHWHCPSSLSLIEAAEHNRQARLRVEGLPGSRVTLSCAEYCGADPRHAWVYVFYAPNDEEMSDSLVDSLIYCRCPSVAHGEKPAPPTPDAYRAELRRDRDWTALAEADRLCSGRGRLGVEAHNARLAGRRCGSRGKRLRLVCREGEIDRCSRFASAATPGAEPWNHRCEPH